MTTPFDYALLLEQFLGEIISAEEFQAIYLDHLKNEEMLDEPLFKLLDELFGDVDAFTNDPNLLNTNRSFYIDKKTLRDKVLSMHDRLISLKRRHRRPRQTP